VSTQAVTISTNGSTSTGNISRITLVSQAVTGPPGAAGGSPALDDVTDVTITSAATGDVLRYNGSAWVDYPDSNYATASSVSDHLADTTAAHAASAISFSATGSIAATDVQTAIAEVATDAAAAYQPLASVLTNTTAAFTTAQESKLSGIEAAADVTDAANVDAAGAVMNSDSSTASMSFVIDEDNMATDSATKVPTQQSVKAYADLRVPKTGAGNIEYTLTPVAATGATENIDMDVGYHELTMDQNCTFTFTNKAGTSEAKTTVFRLIGAYTATFTDGEYGDGAAPTYTTPSLYTATSRNNQAKVLIAQVAKAIA